MKNGVQSGETLDYTNTTGVAIASGAPVVVGSLIGVAFETIANNAMGALAMTGVYSMPKAAGVAVTQGQALTFDVSAGTFTTAAPATGDITGNCTAWDAAAAGDATVNVKLSGSGGVVAA